MDLEHPLFHYVHWSIATNKWPACSAKKLRKSYAQYMHNTELLGKSMCSSSGSQSGHNDSTNHGNTERSSSVKSQPLGFHSCPRRLRIRTKLYMTHQGSMEWCTLMTVVSQPPKNNCSMLTLGLSSFCCQTAFLCSKQFLRLRSWTYRFVTASARVHGDRPQTSSCYQLGCGYEEPIEDGHCRLTDFHVWSLFLKHFCHHHLDSVRYWVNQTSF